MSNEQMLQRLKNAIREANDALFDEMSMLDVEHTIQCHSDTLPEAYRNLAVAAEKAFDILQIEVYKLLGE